jgi:hypothetical protein
MGLTPKRKHGASDFVTNGRYIREKSSDPLFCYDTLRTAYVDAMLQIAEFIPVLSCRLFTGASVYINLVEHPARMECGVEIAATEFAPSYRRAAIMQASSAALGLLSSIAAWLAGATFWWLVAGALLGSVIPFTLFVILPTNKLLLSPGLDRRSAQTERLLARWNALHTVRSVLCGLALLLFLYFLIKKSL